MEIYNIITEVLTRNGLDGLYHRRNDAAVKYLKNKMDEGGYPLNIEISSQVLIDDTVQLQYTQLVDNEEELSFITDIKLGLVCDSAPYINAIELFPALRPPECDKDYIWGTRYLIFRKQLIVIEGCGNCYISYKICDVSSDMIDLIKIVYGSLSNLSKKQAEEIAEQCSGQKITL